MQAIILAAGMGARLGKYTIENTKCMLNINGKTLIEQSLENINAVGIHKVIIVVGYKRENLIDFLGNKFKEIKIEYIVNPIYDQTNNIYSLFLAKEKLLQDDTLLIESDLIFERDILNKLLEDPRENLAVVDKYQSWMDGTVVKLDAEDNIVTFVPKKFFDYTEIEKYYKTVNIYKFSKIFSTNVYIPFLEAYSSAIGRNEYYEQVLRVIVTLEHNDLKALKLEGEKWYEIDDVQDKDNAETIFAQNFKMGLENIKNKYGGYWRYPYLKDFCYLVNPYFPTNRMENEIKAYFHDLIAQYPSGLNVQNKLAGKLFNLEPDTITVGNGASELIRMLASSLPGIFGMMMPSFNEYQESIGFGRIIKCNAEKTGLSYSKEILLHLASQCDILLLINPDNPSGHFIEKNDLLVIAEALSETGKYFVLDESFVDFSSNGENNSLLNQATLNKYPNLVVIRSISKSYGIPGIRLGVLATSNQDIMAKVRCNLPIWNINSIGEFFLQIIGKHRNEYSLACLEVATERNRFFKELEKFDFLEIFPSQANYFLCGIKTRFTATFLTEELLGRYGIYIKDLSGKNGLEHGEFVRIAIKDIDNNQYLIKCLHHLIK